MACGASWGQWLQIDAIFSVDDTATTRHGVSVNAYASLFLAAYLVAVLSAGNQSQLVVELKKEGDFLKWAAALIIVVGVSGYLGDAGGVLVFMVFAALLINAVSQNPKIFDNLTSALRIGGQ